MNQNELNKILVDHKLWLETEGKEGKRADLRGANLSCVDLEGVDLAGADLKFADLEEAKLKEADLRNAILAGADLKFADLEGADFEGANLTGTNLKGAWLDSDWKGVPILLGNVLVTECYKLNNYYYWRIKTWSIIKEDNQELYETLYL